ncbi:MAG: hypothetical protein HY917_02920 [Candidatus Diapherotrites archaeon]|nr:hypothetical protein [Candidatus Diapherotrites archaeon]
MLETIVRVKRWGNSTGILVSKKLLEQEGIQENEEVAVNIRKLARLPDSRGFGSLKHLKIDAQKEKDRSREESDW